MNLKVLCLHCFLAGLLSILGACGKEARSSDLLVYGSDKNRLERSLNNTDKLFVKLGQKGNVLEKQKMDWSDVGDEISGTQWRCVKDVKTGLVWEVKSSDKKSSRFHQLNYQWYFDEYALSGGNKGFNSKQDCNGVHCDTQSYQRYLNNIKLCGISNWQLPTVLQFQTVVDHHTTPIALNVRFFPNAHNSHYWTKQSYAPDRSHAWYVYFSDGSVSNTLKGQPMFLRLVSAPK